MAERWDDDLASDALQSDDDKVYMEALAKVKAGLAKGFDFESASALIDIKDRALREAVLDDVLKVVIAEEHFARKVPIEQISKTLNLPEERVLKARAEMFDDVERSSVNSLYKKMGNGTEH